MSTKKGPTVKEGDFFLNRNDKLCIVTETSSRSVMYKLVCGAGSAFHYPAAPATFRTRIVNRMLRDDQLAPYIRKAKLNPDSKINLAAVDGMVMETHRILGRTLHGTDQR